MRQYKVIIVTVQVMLFSQSLWCGFDRINQPTTVFARGYSGVAMPNAEHLFLNPAAIDRASLSTTSLFYSPSPFQLKQLMNYGLLSVHPFETINAGIAVTTIGFSLYRETSAILASAVPVTNEFSVGASVHFNHLFIERYGTSLEFQTDLGAIYAVSGRINIGIAVQNAFGSTPADEDVPKQLTAGVSLHPADKTTVNLDLLKDIRFPVAYRAGIEFSIHEQVIVRSGMQTDRSQLFGGISIKLHPIVFHYGISTHSYLGITHSVGMSLNY